MFSCNRLCLFCVVAVLCIHLCPGSSHTKKCTETDKEALLKLKDGFINGSHILSSWNGGDCCKWKGVSCNNLTAHVTRLDLWFSYSISVTGDEDLNDGSNMPEDLEFNTSGALGGEIPLSTQLQSFDASAYIGNIGLCGPPLPNQCPCDVIPPSGKVDENATNEDEDKLINFGFYISLGLGFCVGFWSVCGTLIIKSSWRYAYFQFFNHIYDWIYVTVVVFTARMKKRFQIQD